ncbi:SDR family NAD(P)-dependent oxidoreductase [Agrobacterium rubi]|uniref:SDR family NAD(P)-dependent oxidoreductase n=1 Tax=Agrobacterium rubi TaxID=28099 RepID=UPI00307DF48F
MEIVCQFRRIDVIVNNAGITRCAGPVDSTPHAHDPENTELSDWRAVNAVNSDGTFLGCRCAMKAMRENGAGSIINISSRSGLVGIPMLRPMPHPKRQFATTPRASLSIAPVRSEHPLQLYPPRCCDDPHVEADARHGAGS